MSISRQVGLASGMMTLVATVLAATFAPPLVTAAPVVKQAAAQPMSATTLLQNTMTRYAALSTLRAHATWKFETTPAEGQTSVETRTLIYAKPNKFHVISANSNLTMSTVSDGKTMVQYTSSADMPAQSSSSPTSIGTSSAMYLKHFMFGGTPLLQFFDGPSAQSRLVAAGSTVVSKPDAVVGTVPCRVIGFMATGSYGNTEIAIGKTDGLVHRITYDIAPLQKATQEPSKAPTSVKITETYDVLQPNAKVTAADFSTTLPKGIGTAAKVEEEKEPGPPVPVGQMAPDFTVTPIGATAPAKLSDYKGQVVLLDFWATWCPPCRKSLPETERLNATYGGKGLKVFAISDEKPETINPFIAQNKYTFPVYVDSTNSANKAYGIVAIPTFAIIDKEGKLSAFFVGLPEDGTIEAALKKAGLGTP